MDQPTPEDLEDDQNIDGKPNSMVWIRQRSLGPDRKVTQHKDDSCKQQRRDVEPCVQFECPVPIKQRVIPDD